MTRASRPDPPTRLDLKPGPVGVEAPSDGSAAVLQGYRGTVDWDAPCGRCGYNLRGLELRGRCPECGAPAWQSLGDDTLASADEPWLHRLQAGAATCNAAFIAAITLGIAIPFLRSAGGTGLLLLLGAACAAAYGAGLWLMTAPNPAASSEERRTSYRRIARTMLLIAAPGAVLNVMVLLGAPRSGALLAGNLLFSPVGLAGALGVMSWSQVAAEFARRGDYRALETRALLIGSGYLFSWIASIVFALLSRVMMPAGVLLVVSGVTAGGFGLAALWLPFRLSSVFRDALAERRRPVQARVVPETRVLPGLEKPE